MNIGIVGSRTFNDFDLLLRTINRICKMFAEHEITIVSGGAQGADYLAEEYAKENDLKTIIFKAEWEIYGKAAGFARNRHIVDSSDFLVAFWDGKSRGTNNTMNKAIKTGKPILVVPF
jgi:predicted Rossmann fold nucleotide-binding protein DprA/Smf involved in DNA uptake